MTTTRPVPSVEPLYCVTCRRASCACGSSLAFARRRASALRAGDELVEADGALLTVTGVEPDGRQHVVVTLRSFGASRVGPIRCGSGRLFSVAVRREQNPVAQVAALLAADPNVDPVFAAAVGGRS